MKPLKHIHQLDANLNTRFKSEQSVMFIMQSSERVTKLVHDDKILHDLLLFKYVLYSNLFILLLIVLLANCVCHLLPSFEHHIALVNISICLL